MRLRLLVPLLCAALTACGSNPTVPIVGAGEEEQPLAVGNITELGGTDYVVANMTGGGKGETTFSASRSETSVRNLLLIRKDGGETRPLLPDDNGVVDRAYFVPARPALLLTPYDDYTQPADQNGKPVPPVYFIVEGRAAPREALSVRVGAMAGFKSAVVLGELDAILGRWMIDDHRLAVIATQKATTRYYEIDMKARALIGSHDIPLGE